MKLLMPDLLKFTTEAEVFIALRRQTHEATRKRAKKFCLYTLIKKKRRFSSYIRKFRWDRVQSHMYMRKGSLIYEEMRKYLAIYEEAVSHI